MSVAQLPELKSPVAAAIEAHYESQIELRDGNGIPCSKLAEPCERSLWYSFRWATPLVRHSGRMQRLFTTGHREEARMIADLRAIGCEVQEVDPETGKQWRVEMWGGVLSGYMDGIVSNVPGAEKTLHVLECKTHNNKSFQEWRRLGVEKAKPEHYGQMQIYMCIKGLSRSLYIGENKDTDEVESERGKADVLYGSTLITKAERIAWANDPPPRTESFKCRWCRHHDICLGGGQMGTPWARVNCRTCMRSELGKDGKWRCTENGAELDYEAQQRGCPAHLFLPGLVPGEQIDASEEEQTVTYQIPNGAVYVDGRDPKPAVPAVQP